MAPPNVHQIDPYAVGRISELGGRPRADEARELLEAVAQQVQPIMRRRQLTVPSLIEFFPDNSNLLGLNVGGGGGSCMEIRVRLRPARSPGSFLPYDSILGTMLHELVHCHISPHNAAFYKLLDELNAECDDLIARGISGSGAGFDAPAAGKVGGRFTGRADDVPAHRLRELARQAAEARLKRQAVMTSGPRTTGGGAADSLRHLPPREAAAAAAERRLRDNTWCPTEALGNEAAAGHDVNAALRAILDNAGAGQRPPPPPQQQPAQQQQQQPVQQQQQQQPPQQQAQQQPPQQQAQQSQEQPPQQQAQQQPPQQQAPLPPQQQLLPPQQPQRQAAAPPSSGADVIDLTADHDDETPAAAAGGGDGSRHRGGSTATTDAQWACPACTLINAPLALACGACGGVRPAGWRG